MRRLVRLLSVLLLLTTACGDDSASTQAPATTGAPATTQAATTTKGTAAPATTRSTAAPATTPAPLQTLLPDARSRDDVPWEEVDKSWALALFSTKPGYSDVEPIGEIVVVAYLVAPDGTPYEITRWPESEAPRGIHDVRPDGQRALLHSRKDIYDALVLDLTTGTTGPLPFSVEAFSYGFTRPTGRDYLALTFDSFVEMYSADGDHLATLGQYLEEQDFHFGPQRPWVFAPTGLSLAVNGSLGPTHVDNQGNHLGDLFVGNQEFCHVLAWWNDADVLMRCLDTYQGRNELGLWLVDTGGLYPNFPIDSAPGGRPEIEGFGGFLNALEGGGKIFYQGWVVVGYSSYPIFRVVPDVGMMPFGDDVAGELIVAGPDSFTVHDLYKSGVEYGGLITYDHDGNEISRLDAPEGYYGVIYAYGVGAP